MGAGRTFGTGKGPPRIGEFEREAETHMLLQAREVLAIEAVTYP